VDYIFLSHSHYDHVGALPYVLDRWPQTKVCASEKTKYIFSREGAIKLMKELGEAARDEYTDSKAEIRTDGLRVDIVLADNDTIKLGKETVRALETKGHTDCSMSYAVEPQKVLFTSESTGVVVPQKAYVSSEILKSMADSLAACDKCEAYAPEIIICPHYGVVPKVFNKEYFKSMKADAERKKALVKEFADRGMNEEEILEAYRDKLYEPGEQPLSAFLENAANVIRVMLKEINKD
jgi:2-aminobenzoylacetyl-CoA thioesterase